MLSNVIFIHLGEIMEYGEKIGCLDDEYLKY
jgi:hypothetical protein